MFHWDNPRDVGTLISDSDGTAKYYRGPGAGTPVYLTQARARSRDFIKGGDAIFLLTMEGWCSVNHASSHTHHRHAERLSAMPFQVLPAGCVMIRHVETSHCHLLLLGYTTRFQASLSLSGSVCILWDLPCPHLDGVALLIGTHDHTWGLLFQHSWPIT